MKDKLRMILFILIFGSILTTALVAVNFYTTPIINKNEEITLKSSVLKALNIPFEEGNVTDIETQFDNNVDRKTADGVTYYLSTDGTYAFLFEGSGLWGPIRGVLAMKRDVQTIQRITIIHQEETPGLGSRIAEQEYLENFQGKTFSPELDLTGEGKADENNEIDAITGATLSCNAFVKILNEQHKKYTSIVEGK